MKDIYQNYDALQLAADEDFIRWVQRGTPEESAVMEAWLDRFPGQRPVVDEARRLVSGMSFQPREPKVDTAQLWNRIQTSSRQPAIEKQIPGRRRFLYIAGSAAAAVALVLFVVFGLGQSTTIKTNLGEHLAHVLPDQSNVRINAGSVLSYDKTGREIELEGEAYFEVQKGERFSVQTPLGQVQVLGTQFNVFSREDRFWVQCTEGRVQVTAPNDREGVILTAGMACELQTDGSLKMVAPLGDESNIGWLEDIYRFKNSRLSDFFSELERQFDVKVEADEAVLNLVQDGFFTAENLDSALQQICFPYNLTYTVDGREVRIEQ